MPPISLKVKTTIDTIKAERDELLRQNAAILAEQGILNARIADLQESLQDARVKLNTMQRVIEAATKFKCECGDTLALSSKHKHLKSPTHLMKMKCMIGDKVDVAEPEPKPKPKLKPKQCSNCDGKKHEYYGDGVYGPCLRCGDINDGPMFSD